MKIVTVEVHMGKTYVCYFVTKKTQVFSKGSTSFTYKIHIFPRKVRGLELLKHNIRLFSFLFKHITGGLIKKKVSILISSFSSVPLFSKGL